jgi:beta-mannosidase
MQAHNKALGGNGILNKYISMYYHTPKDFNSYLYISQVLQAEGMKLEKPHISKAISATDQGYLITLSADKLVKDLYLSTDEKGQFSDNYFDLLPGKKVTVNFNTKEKIENFESKLNLVSVVDTY